MTAILCRILDSMLKEQGIYMAIHVTSLHRIKILFTFLVVRCGLTAEISTSFKYVLLCESKYMILKTLLTAVLIG
jgi:hypothetical protein